MQVSSLYSTTYHLKSHKRDAFIEFIKSLLLTPFILNFQTSTVKDSLTTSTDRNHLNRYLEVLGCLEDLIQDSIYWSSQGHPHNARLKRLCPSIGTFFTPLPLVEAFKELERDRSFIGRRFVPPSFNDIRYLLNLAQIHAISGELELITFDGDMTLYADGADFARDSKLVVLLVELLRLGKKVAIVTAAGYPGNPARYEQRLSGLLHSFRQEQAASSSCDFFSNFYVLGGECNYLFQYNPHSQHLIYLEPEMYRPEFMRSWSSEESQIQALLSVAENHLKARIQDMGISDRVSILRKSRAVGVNPIAVSAPLPTTTTGSAGAAASSASAGSLASHHTTLLHREQLDELALSVQDELHRYQMMGGVDVGSIPFCAFNGGSDVWVDIGNKLIGVKVSP